MTQINDAGITGSEYMAQADMACYIAKHNGRGRVYKYEPAQKTATAHTSGAIPPEDHQSGTEVSR